jgi:hypothetical protein
MGIQVDTSPLSILTIDKHSATHFPMIHSYVMIDIPHAHAGPFKHAERAGGRCQSGDTITHILL